MKKNPKKLRLSMETVKSLDLPSAAAALANDISSGCQETLKNIVCSTMP